ncbi:MAG TPA: hypothetical protein VMV72_11420 [Verrucomicrobiae bacterium]|nr:hypothetical protein [Verrucomicrobiae bacterium]
MIDATRHELPAEPHRWWLPSLSQFIWVVLFLSIMLTDWRQTLINADGDPCWHWRLGQWMIEHRAIIRSDVFSHTQPGALIVTKEWLSEVIFAAAGNALGWNGVVLVAAVLIATTLALLHRQLVAEGNDIVASTFAVLLAGVACMVHWLARPHLFTLLLVVIFAWQLRWYDRGRISARQLWIRLVPLTALWANLHGGFLTAFVLIDIHFVGNYLRIKNTDAPARAAVRNKLIVLAALAVACALATLLNPNGWKLHRYLISFLSVANRSRFTSEWSSANFHFSGLRGFEWQLLLLGFLLIVVRRPWAATDLLLVGVWLWSALYAMRNVPIFALIVTPAFAEHLSAAFREARNTMWGRRLWELSEDVSAVNRASGGGGLIAAVMIVMIIVVARPVIANGAPLLETRISSRRFPCESVDYLRAHPQIVHGGMFNEDGWGGYFLLYLPERKVFIDGRDDFYPEAFLQEFTEVSHLRPAWETVLAKYRVGWTILPAQHPLNRIMELSPGWTRVYSDRLTLIFSRVS